MMSSNSLVSRNTSDDSPLNGPYDIAKFKSTNEQDLMCSWAWLIGNLCRRKPFKFHLFVSLVPLLLRLLHHSDEQILSETCWTLAYIADNVRSNLKVVFTAGSCEKLVSLLATHEAVSIVIPILKISIALLDPDSGLRRDVQDAGLLIQVNNLLTHPHFLVRKKCCILLATLFSMYFSWP
jgi:importin subunit alpha-1